MSKTKEPEPTEPATPKYKEPEVYPIVHGFRGLTAHGQALIMELMRKEAKIRDENPGMKNPMMHKSKPKPPPAE